MLDRVEEVSQVWLVPLDEPPGDFIIGQGAVGRGQELIGGKAARLHFLDIDEVRVEPGFEFRGKDQEAAGEADDKQGQAGEEPHP